MAKLWARMLPQHPNGSIQREHLQSKLRQAGLGYVGPGEVDAILDATGDKKALRFFRLCAFCGREPERLPPPSPVKKRKKRVSIPRPATAPPRIQRKAVKPPPPRPGDDAAADGDAVDKAAPTALQAALELPLVGTLDALRSRGRGRIRIRGSTRAKPLKSTWPTPRRSCARPAPRRCERPRPSVLKVRKSEKGTGRSWRREQASSCRKSAKLPGP